MKNLLFLPLLLSLLACNQSPQNAGTKPAKNGKYQRFQFSDKKATQDMNDPANWCAARFGESALISADPKNFNRRLFALGDVPLRVVVEGGKLSSTFMLEPYGDHVALLTSDNQPACLSNKANLQLSSDGLSFHYDNKMQIHYDVYLQELPSGIQIALDFPPDYNYGLSAYRCETCK